MTQDTLTSFIELNVFLGKISMVETGGQAKRLIRSGEVKVNGELETRNKRKLHAGDMVEYLGKMYIIEEKLLRQAYALHNL